MAHFHTKYQESSITKVSRRCACQLQATRVYLFVLWDYYWKSGNIDVIVVLFSEILVYFAIYNSRVSFKNKLYSSIYLWHSVICFETHKQKTLV